MEKRQLAAVWSFVGTYILVLAIGLSFAPTAEIFRDLGLFFSGDAASIARGSSLLLVMLPTVLLVLAIEFPLSLATGLGVAKVLGKAQNSVSGMLNDLRERHVFFSLFVLVLLEELYARWLFLGVLPRIPGLSGPVAFYALLLIGNGTWALVHLWNYKKAEDRNPLRVASQFIGGLFLSYVFVKHGLLAAVLAHFASNALVFAMVKVQNVNRIDALFIGLNAIYALVSYAVMDRPIGDIAVWFDGSGRFAIPGWEFGDYLAISVFIGSCSALAFDSLLYDRSGIGERGGSSSKVGPVGMVIGITIVIAVMLGLVYGLYWLLGLVVGDAVTRIVILTLLLAFCMKAPSGSAAMRAFWTHLPGTFVFICITQAMGFAGAFAYLLVAMVISIPSLVLHRLDD